jgi:hypothetical protein
MRKLDQRGVAAFEFCLVAIPLFTLMFVIFDLGRYAITTQSLRTLANAGARAMMIYCYTPTVIGTTPLSPWSATNTSPSSCTGDPLPSDAAKQAVAPLLYTTGGPPTLSIPAPAVGATALTVKASQPGFKMIWPIWGTAFDAPSASTSVPF